MGSTMLKYGLIHGVVFVLIMLGLSFLLAWVELSDNVFEVVYMVALFAPLMIVGYRYKAKNRCKSPFCAQ